jgi:hypothetical protein
MTFDLSRTLEEMRTSIPGALGHGVITDGRRDCLRRSPAKLGCPNETWDRIQNHARMDVSKSYERWNHLREKRSGMAKWSDRHCRA